MASLYSFCRTLSFFLGLGLPAFAGSVKDPNPIDFKKDKIILSGKTISIELAENELQRSHGLMYRDKMKDMEGMLFIFEYEQSLSFWMKNTFLDLSIGYFDKNRTLVDVQEMRAMNSVVGENLPSYPSIKPAMYALEMNKGWFAKNKVKVGAKFEFVGVPKSRSKSKTLKCTKYFASPRNYA